MATAEPGASTRPQFITAALPPGTEVAGGIQEEAERLFAALEADLEGRGLTFHDVVALRYFYTERSDYLEMNDVRAGFFRPRFRDHAYPVSTGVVTGGRGGATPRLELEVLAAPGKQVTNSDRVYRTFRGATEPPAFVHAGRIAGLLLLSGQVGFDLDLKLVDPGPTGQAVRALENLEHVIQDCGRGPGDVLGYTVYLTRPEDRAEVEAVVDAFAKRRYADDRRPVITYVYVGELFMPGVLVEVDAIAADGEPVTVVPSGAPDAAGARAARAGRWARADGVARGEEPDRLVAQAADALAANLAEVGAGLDDVVRVTAWFSPAGAREAVESALAARFGDAARMAVPSPTGDGGATLQLEALADLERSA